MTAPHAETALSAYAGAANRPVFIGASPRSGTTMLRLMINASPEIAIPRETKVLVTAWDERRSFGDLADVENRKRLADRLVDVLPGPNSPRLGPKPPQLRELMIDAPPTLGSVVGTCFAAYAETKGKVRWGDKRPVYSRYLDAVFSMFPDAQFIHMVRDPRAASSSMASMWYDGKFAPAVELWERSMRAVEAWRSLLAPDQFIEIKFETLVAEPEAELTRLAGFLSLDPLSVDKMMRFYENPDETSAVHPDVNKPPQPDNIDKWRKNTTSAQAALVESITGEWMERYGYARSSQKAKPTSEALKVYRKRVAKQAEARAVDEAEERRILDQAPLPVAALLTPAQQAGTKAPELPPLDERWIGRPA